MMLKIFTVYDTKVGAYLNPFFLRSTAEAIRSFEQICNEENHQFYKHPSDFTLFEIGTFDDTTCKIHTHAALQSLGIAQEFKRQQQLPLVS